MSYSHLKFGCEFEFCPNMMLEEDMIDALEDILKEGIELKKNLESNDDNNMNYKDELSL